MSAPDTNIEREAKRHKPALGGIGAAIGAILALVVGIGLYASASGIGMNDATPAQTGEPAAVVD